VLPALVDVGMVLVIFTSWVGDDFGLGILAASIEKMLLGSSTPSLLIFSGLSTLSIAIDVASLEGVALISLEVVAVAASPPPKPRKENPLLVMLSELLAASKPPIFVLWEASVLLFWSLLLPVEDERKLKLEDVPDDDERSIPDADNDDDGMVPVLLVLVVAIDVKNENPLVAAGEGAASDAAPAI